MALNSRRSLSNTRALADAPPTQTSDFTCYFSPFDSFSDFSMTSTWVHAFQSFSLKSFSVKSAYRLRPLCITSDDSPPNIRHARFQRVALKKAWPWRNDGSSKFKAITKGQRSDHCIKKEFFQRKSSKSHNFSLASSSSKKTSRFKSFQSFEFKRLIDLLDSVLISTKAFRWRLKNCGWILKKNKLFEKKRSFLESL